MQTDTCLLNGQAFHLRRWGHPDLPPLLMLHGFPEYSGAWEDLAPLLADRFHCVAPDQRGYGQSYAPAGVEAYRISQLVSDMAALIDQLGGQVILMGHDWGASVAYALAARHPEKVSRLIVANGVHPVPFQRELAKGEAQSEASQYINGLRQEGIEEALEHNNYRQVIRTLHMDTDMSWMSHARRADYIEAWSLSLGRAPSCRTTTSLLLAVGSRHQEQYLAHSLANSVFKYQTEFGLLLKAS